MRIVGSLLALAIGLILVPPAIFLTGVWLRDGAQALPVPPAGTNDVSRMSPGQTADVVKLAEDPAHAEEQIVALVLSARERRLPVAISGARHSMGGHTLSPGGVVLDMNGFDRMELDEPTRILTVGAGALWSQVIPFLDRRGFSVAVMQANNDFTVGGSLSVNCHGWQNDTPPISSTVESFRLVTASGEVVRCSRSENAELFSLALGGYGLFGVILEARLRVVANDLYRAEAHAVDAVDYDRTYHELTGAGQEVGLAYGRVNVARDGFLEKSIVTILRKVNPAGGPVPFAAPRPNALKRLVFRGQVGSAYGKSLRWRLERLVGETGGGIVSRNTLLNEPSDFFASRDADASDVLQEYFVPVARLGDFLGRARFILLRHQPDLLNVTLRNVEADTDTVLRYAREEVFGVVMLFHQKRDAAAETAMGSLTRELIDAALACGGRYYLPYRPHATRAQFLASYPESRVFFERKRLYDPDGLFQNQFFARYGGSPTAAP